MSAKKAKSKQKPAVLATHLKQLTGLFQGWGRGVPLALLIIAAFSALWYAVWREVGRQVLSSDRYWLTREKVEITPQPEWIQGDVRAGVFRDASLDGPVSIMDEELAARIANAFSLHPWVAKVRWVRKRHPACVRVELVYRRPVCVVDVRGELLPVDEAGVLLPQLSPTEARKYPRLEGVGTTPIAPEGTRWGDVRVFGGAKIAAAFGPAWQVLSLERIVPSSMVAVDHADEYTYQLVTRAGTRIHWGRPPGMEAVGEPPAVDKVAWLLERQKRNGTLEGSEGRKNSTSARWHPAKTAQGLPAAWASRSDREASEAGFGPRAALHPAATQAGSLLRKTRFGAAVTGGWPDWGRAARPPADA